jgi:hypothetical protein
MQRDYDLISCNDSSIGVRRNNMNIVTLILQSLAALVLVGLYGLPVLCVLMVLLTDRKSNSKE